MVLLILWLFAMYILFGLFTHISMFDDVFDIENPLFQPLPVLFWPIGLLVVLVMMIITWVKAVITYYKDKKVKVVRDDSSRSD